LSIAVIIFFLFARRVERGEQRRDDALEARVVQSVQIGKNADKLIALATARDYTSRRLRPYRYDEQRRKRFTANDTHTPFRIAFVTLVR